jgi:hypothetical protein
MVLLKAMTMAILSKHNGGQVKKGQTDSGLRGAGNFRRHLRSPFRSTPTVSQKYEMVLISRSWGAAG